MQISSKVFVRRVLQSVVVAVSVVALQGAAAPAQVDSVDQSRDGQDTISVRSGSGPSYVQLRRLAYAGSGCPAGSLVGAIGAGRDSVTLSFSDSFAAEVGPGVPLSASRKSCNLSIDLNFPSGWQYSVSTVDHAGFVDLEAGVRADISSSYYFQGQSTTARLSATLMGPTSRDYQIRDTFGAAQTLWSPCGATRALNIGFQIRVTGPTGQSGIATMESPLGGSTPPMALKWRRC